MKIYYETIFILNFILDYMILYGTKRILKQSSKNKRLLLGSLFGAMSTFILTIQISSIELFLLKIEISIGMILISFGRKKILQKTLYFYSLSTILGGSIYLLDIHENIQKQMILLIMLTPIILKIFITEWKRVRENISNKYNVTIEYKNKKYKLMGFIDTGNRLKSPISNKPIILVNIKIPANKVIYIPYKALNYEGVIPCIKPDKIIINDKEIKNCLVGLAKEKFQLDDLDCILPNKLKEELC